MSVLNRILLVASLTVPVALHAQAAILTHSADNTMILPGNSAACTTMAAPQITRDNSYWRSYTLANFGITSPTYVIGAQFAVEDCTPGTLAVPPELPFELRIYDDRLPPNPAPLAGLTLRHTEPFTLPPLVNTIVTYVYAGTAVSCTVNAPMLTPISGPVTLEVDAVGDQILPTLFQPSETVVVELFSPDAAPTSSGATTDRAVFFIGSNDLGQTDPSYLSSPVGCAIAEPTDAATLGATTMNQILDLIVDPTPPPPAPSLTITVEWSPAGMGTFNPCTMTAMSPNPNPTTGASTSLLDYTWDAVADGAGTSGPEQIDILVTILDVSSGNMNTCMLTTQVDNGGATCPTVCGDCDANGLAPQIPDALRAAQLGAGIAMPSPSQQICCDVDGSMSVNILDALAIARGAAGLGFVPGCP